MNTDSQWSKQEACFTRANQVWLAVNHNTSVTSDEWIWWSKRIPRVSELGSCQSNVFHSWGYERLQKSKDSLKACFENVNISWWLKQCPLLELDPLTKLSWSSHDSICLGLHQAAIFIFFRRDKWGWFCGWCITVAREYLGQYASLSDITRGNERKTP